MTEAIKKILKSERDKKIRQILKLQYEVNQLGEQIKYNSFRPRTKSIGVTNHAVERFKERVMDMPAEEIRNLLSSKELFEAYTKRGNGRYNINEMPHVMAQIVDFTVVTVINTESIEDKFNALKAYMHYFIDTITLKHQGYKARPMKIERFKKMFYKNKRQLRYVISEQKKHWLSYKTP